MTDPLDELLADIDEALGETEDDPFHWSDAMVWSAPELTHCPVTGKVYLDMAGWVL